MTLLGSLRVRSPSPVPPQPARPFAARGAPHTPASPQPATIPTIQLTTATPVLPPDESIAYFVASNSSNGSLAPPLLPKKAPKRVLAPKGSRLNPQRDAIPEPGSSTIPIRNGTWNAATTYRPPAVWDVVPTPPPRTSVNPHQFASARRMAPPPAPPMHAQIRQEPKPVTILPAKTEVGASSRWGENKSSVHASSLRTTSGFVRPSGTSRTQRENTLKVYADEPRQEAPILVKKKKSRLALDLGWELGDRTNGQSKEKDSGTPASATAPRSSTPTLTSKGSIGRLTQALKSKASSSKLSPDSTEESGKENAAPKGKWKWKWKWSMGIGRGRKEPTVKDIPSKRTKSPAPAPAAVRNLATFSSSTDPIEVQYRTPSLDDYPPITAPPPIEKEILLPPATTRSASDPFSTVHPLSREGSLRAPLSTRIPNDQRPSAQRVFSADPVSASAPSRPSSGPLPSIHFGDVATSRSSSPTVMVQVSPPETPGGYLSPTDAEFDRPMSNSLALRATRSMWSMAKIFVSPEDDKVVTMGRSRSKKSKSKGLPLNILSSLAGPRRRHRSPGWSGLQHPSVPPDLFEAISTSPSRSPSSRHRCVNGSPRLFTRRSTRMKLADPPSRPSGPFASRRDGRRKILRGRCPPVPTCHQAQAIPVTAPATAIPPALSSGLRKVINDEARAGFYNISIPDSASALMSNTHLESLFRPTHSRAHSGSSLPPGPAPALRLPERPADSSRFSRATSSSYAGDYDDHTMSSTDSKSTLRSDLSIIVGEGVNRASTAGLHDGPPVLEQLEEEDSPSHSDTDLTDHTCETSFDFTKELDRLNEGGSRMSFVAQLENAFKTPVKLSYHSAEDMPPIPSLGLDSMLVPKDQESRTTANAPAQNGHKRGSEVFQSFSSNSRAYAIANLDLSLVHPAREPKTSSATIVATEPVQNSPKPKKPEHVRAASLSDSLDTSMAALANLNLSLVHPSKPRPHSTSLESNTTSKRHARIAKARAQCRVLVSHNSSVLSTSSFGSVRNPGVPDPFDYGVAPATAVDPNGHGRNESLTSIPSISSYGVLLNSGVKNPFGYNATRSSRFTSEADGTSSIPDVPQGHRSRYSVDSDRSSFFFNSNASRHQRRGNWRDDSIISFTSGSAPPPLSFLNQSSRPDHDRTDSTLSANSAAYAYNTHGAYDGRYAWARRRHDPSRGSILDTSPPVDSDAHALSKTRPVLRYNGAYGRQHEGEHDHLRVNWKEAR